jgi:HAD superfamily hydrolase (TIGR01509 family)
VAGIADAGLRAVLFDMDGLLLDTERLAWEAFQGACADLGIEIAASTYVRCIGSTSEETRRLLLPEVGEPERFDELETCWHRRYERRLHAGGVPCKPGAAELLAWLAERALPRALVTSTRRQLAERKLAEAGLRQHFPLLVCGGETTRGKPHPDPYLAAAAALGLAPESCWALEDSPHGVRAAHAAGCTVIQVPDLVAPDASVRALGHRIEESLVAVLARLQGLV